AAGHIYTVGAAAVARTGAQTTAYGGVENLTVFGSNFFNIFAVDSTSASTVLVGGIRSDAFLVGITSSGNSLDKILGLLTVNGNSGLASTDTLTITDSGGAAPTTYPLPSSSLTRPGGVRISYFNMQSLSLSAGKSNATVAVQSTLAATPVSLDLGLGNDT